MRMKAFGVFVFAGVLAGAGVIGLAGPVLAQDDSSEEEVVTGTGTLVAALTGAGVTGGGDAAATGSFKVEVDAGTGDYCYSLSVKGLRGANKAQLVEGAAGDNGKAVFDLEVTGANGDLCGGGAPTVLKGLLDNPAGYYVQVASTAKPDGAIRGQLAAK